MISLDMIVIFVSNSLGFPYLRQINFQQLVSQDEKAKKRLEYIWLNVSSPLSNL